MLDERDVRADALLSAALDLPETERDGFLNAACGGDEPLRKMVLELLRDADRSGTFLRPGEPLEGALWQNVAATLDGMAGLSPGTVVGAWKVTREIGRGGMAVVYLADRADGQFDQQAALKLMKAGVDTQETIRRFQQERQILASLDHPHIARLLDGGVTSEGRPFFAMEHIEGRPIDRWCDDHRLPIGARLRLFVDAGRAVEFAHRHLVVHRDLKPSNILVTERGQVKLLDFGIAKLLDPAAHHAAPPTDTAVRMMTPQYASPEQVRGAPATTSSDVYQLGLLLYELLTGRRAQVIEGASPTEIERVVCEHVPVRPSAVVGTDGMPTSGAAGAAGAAGIERQRRRLRGDLDNIVMKALRKEPESRYASVSELVDDIERHLAGLPVDARPATFRYLAGRFVRRHTVPVVAGSLLLLSVLAGMVSSLWLARAASIERDRARREAATSLRVSEFLIDTFQVADPSEARGKSVTAVELLDSGARRIEALKDDPEIQATMKDVIGRVYMSLGLYDPAQRMLTDALGIRRTVFDDPSGPVAESLDHLGRALHEKGAYDEAERHLRQGLEMRRRVLGPTHVQVAESLRNLAMLLHFRGKLDDAQPLYEEALAIRRAAYGPRHPQVAESTKDLAMLWMQRGEPARAGTMLQEALDMLREGARADDPRIADTLNALGMAWLNQDDTEKAERFYREALDMRVRVLGPDHPQTASTRGNLAAAYYQRRQYDKAEPLFREALEIQKRKLGKDHPSVALSMTNLGVLLSMRDDPKAAEPLYREALAIRLKAYGEDHVSVAVSRYYIGRLLAERGEYPEAESLMRTALKHLPEKDANRAGLYVDLGEMLMRQGRMAEAGEILQQGVDLTIAVQGPDSWRTGAALSARGAWHLTRVEHAQARADLERAWTLLNPRPADDPRRRKILDRLVALHQALGDKEEEDRYQALRAARPAPALKP